MSRARAIIDGLAGESPRDLLKHKFRNPRFFLVGVAEGTPYYWTYGIPHWYWGRGTPDNGSTRDYKDAKSIAHNLLGKPLGYPRLIGPSVNKIFLVSSTGHGVGEISDVVEAETPREFLKKHAPHVPEMPEEFFEQYLETAIWSSNNDAVDPEGHGHPLDRDYDTGDFTDAARETLRAECEDFWKKNWRDIEGDPSRAGHDFWLTRNGHGAGFWDGDFTDDEEAGERLTAAAHSYGEIYISPTEDGTQLEVM